MTDKSISETMRNRGEGWALSGSDYSQRAFALLQSMAAFREDARHAITHTSGEDLVPVLQLGANIGFNASALLDDMQRDPKTAMLRAERDTLKAERDAPGREDDKRATVQLAGCLMAAEGGGSEMDGREDLYGWSLAGQTVLDLRKERDALKAQFSEIASIEGLTESEDGLPGSVRDLIRSLRTQVANYKRWAAERYDRLVKIEEAMEGYDD